MATISEGIVLDAKNNTRAALGQLQADASRAASSISKDFDNLNKNMKTVGIGLTAAGAGAMAFVTSSTLLAARVQTLGVVLDQVGKNAGYSKEQLDSTENSVKALGITTQVTRENMARMIQANLDLSRATDLARVAQDAAVIAGTNSSEAFERMLNGITTLQPEVLRTMGIVVNFQGEYQKYADKVGIAVTEIDQQTKQQIALTAALEAGKRISGSYEAAMGTAGKQMASMARLVEEAQVAIGEGLLPTFSGIILVASDALKWFNALDSGTKELTGQVLALGGVTLTAAGAFILFVPKVAEGVKVIQSIATASKLAGTAVNLFGVQGAAAATGMSTLGVATAAALGPITVIAAALGIVAVGFTYVAGEARKAKDAIEDAKNAINESGNNAITSGEDYGQYEEAVKRAAAANGLMIDAEGNLIQRKREGQRMSTMVIEKNYLMTQTQFEAEKATLKAAESFHDLAGAHQADRKALEEWLAAGGHATNLFTEWEKKLADQSIETTDAIMVQKQKMAELAAQDDLLYQYGPENLEKLRKHLDDVAQAWQSERDKLSQDVEIKLSVASAGVGGVKGQIADLKKEIENMPLVPLEQWAQQSIDAIGSAVAQGLITPEQAAAAADQVTKALDQGIANMNKGKPIEVPLVMNFSKPATGMGSKGQNLLDNAVMEGAKDVQLAVNVTYTTDDTLATMVSQQDQLKDKTVAYTAAGNAHGELDGMVAQQNNLKDKTVTYTIISIHKTVNEGETGPGFASGGGFVAGMSGIYNENPVTRPEVPVFSRGGYMLTKQDAQAALAGRVGGKSQIREGDTYHVTVNDRMAAAMLLEQMRDRAKARAEGAMAG